MACEIERKFLPANEGWRGLAEPVVIRQGYLCTGGPCAVRVRIAGQTAFLTLKAARSGLCRQEFEYSLPVQEARTILDSLALRPLIEKLRYRIPFAGLTWEVDEFQGDNQGLVIIEVELEHENQPFERPPWVGEEVSHDQRYYNVSLVSNPFRNW